MEHPTRHCDVCGADYRPTYWGPKRKTRTCSPPCRSALNAAESNATLAATRSRKRDRLTCLVCGDGFNSLRVDARYCSPECRRSVARAAWPRKSYSLECDECGQLFAASTTTARVCGQRCRRKRWERLNPGAKRVSDARRDGIVSTGHITERDWQRLVTRNRGCCAYCGVSGAMTMDHVIPLCRGGLHTIGNVLPACPSCNFRKSRRLLVEWRLGRTYGRPATA